MPVQAVKGVTVKYLADHFLTHKEGLIASEELSRRTWADYKVVCDKLVAYFGKDRLVISLRPDDFAGLRKHFAKGRGLVTLWNDVTRTRVVFQHAVKKQLIDRPIAYGDSFEKPTKVKLRIARQEKAKRMFQPEEIRLLLASAKPQLKAMILLGINCGFGNTDCAMLPIGALDLVGGIVEFPRPKQVSSVIARCGRKRFKPCKRFSASRPKGSKVLADRVFVTKYNHGWESRVKSENDKKVSRDDPIAKETGKLLRKLGLHKPGLGF